MRSIGDRFRSEPFYFVLSLALVVGIGILVNTIFGGLGGTAAFVALIAVAVALVSSYHLDGGRR